MIEKIGHIPRDSRKRILFLGDSIIGISGVANISRAIITGTAHHYNYTNIGVSQDASIKGKRFDLCQATNTEVGIDDSDVKAIQWDSYDDIELIRQVIAAEKPDAIVFITDPRYYQNLFAMAHEIQHSNGIPMCYIQIWDEFPAPFYNRAAWSSVNLSLCISKQTLLMNKIVLGDRADKTKLEYFPHGVDVEKFKPVAYDDKDLLNFKKDLFNGEDYDFVLFFNSRNIQRKNIPTALLAFKAFLKKLPKEKADKCCFILHTQPVDNNGTDLPAVVQAIFGPNKKQIIFDSNMCIPENLNLRYNLADATVLISEAEGFGLSGLESIASGTPIIVNMTGGMQDYCNIKDKDGKWFTPSEEVWSNHNKTYKMKGRSETPWVFPVWPTALTLVGSVPTPYIFASRCDFKDVADQMMEVYKVYDYLEEDGKLKEFGAMGRQWIQKDEVGMTTTHMADNFIKHIDNMLDTWEPIDRYTVIPLDGTETLDHVELPDYLFERN